jgi:hypothetical protein
VTCPVPNLKTGASALACNSLPISMPTRRGISGTVLSEKYP